VARFKVTCRKYGITEVSLQGNSIRFSPVLLPESAQLRLQRLYDKTAYKPTVSTMSAGRPKGARQADGTFAPVKFGGEPLRDQALLAWCVELLDAILGPVLEAVLAN
jgi:transcription-repair coupling factor (superfamily II helicase)